MAQTEDEKMTEAVRTIESRVVWLLAFLVGRATVPSSGAEGAAEGADKALDSYQERFPAIKP